MTHSADDEGWVLYSSMKRTQKCIGFFRIKLGALLVALHQTQEWRKHSPAKSFRQFLISESIDPNAAAQYMKVAQKFSYDLDVDQEVIKELSTGSMRVLLRAADVATKENLADVVGIVSSMSKNEAIHALEKYDAGHEERRFSSRKQSAAVSKVLDQIDTLGFAERIELMTKLSDTTKSKSQPRIQT